MYERHGSRAKPSPEFWLGLNAAKCAADPANPSYVCVVSVIHDATLGRFEGEVTRDHQGYPRDGRDLRVVW